MIANRLLGPLAFAVLSLACLGQSNAAVHEFLRYDFDSETPGDPVITTFQTTPYPQSHPYATGGFPNIAPHTGTAAIGNPQGFSNAVVLSTTQGGIGANYLDTQFLVSGNLVMLEFDLAILASPTSAVPQATASAPNGQVFVINTFNLNSQVTWRFAATPTSPEGGSFGMRNNTDGDLVLFANYELGKKYHIAIVANFLSSTVNVFIDGNLALSDHPFVNPGPGISEFFIFQNGVEGIQNTVALDNIVGSFDDGAVPEPATLTMFAFGIVSFAAMRRRFAEPPKA